MVRIINSLKKIKQLISFEKTSCSGRGLLFERFSFSPQQNDDVALKISDFFVVGTNFCQVAQVIFTIYRMFVQNIRFSVCHLRLLAIW